MTKAELLALPYGDGVSSAPLPKSSLLALSYTGSSAPAKGLVASEYAKLHAEHGEEFHLWEAVQSKDAPNRSGNVYTELNLSGEKALFYQSKTAVEDERFGLIQTGTSMFSVLPSVVEVMEKSKVLRVAQSRRGAAQITASGTGFDALPQRFVAAIESVTDESGAALALAFAVQSATGVNDSDAGGIAWLGAAPAEGTRLTVKYRYRPLFVCLGEMIHGQPIGADGERLPQNVVLAMERG